MKTRSYLKILVPLTLAVALGVVVIRVGTFLRPQVLPLQTKPFGLAVTSDGGTVLQGDFNVGRVESFDLAKGLLITLSTNPDDPSLGANSLVSVPGTRLVAATGDFTGNSGRSIGLHDLDFPSQVRVLAPRQVTGPALAASPDGKLVVAFNDRGQLCFWDVATGNLKRAFGDFRGALRASEMEAVKKNAPTLVGKLKGPPPMSLAFSPDGKTIAMGGLYYLGNFSRDANAPSDVTLLNVKTGLKIRSFAIPAAAQMKSSFGMGWSVFTCTSLVFSPDGQWLATDSNGDGVCIWDVKTGGLKHVLAHPEGTLGGSHLFGGRTVTFSPDNQLVAAAGNHGSLDIWDVKSGNLRRQLNASGPAVFLPDGRLLTGGPGGRGARQIWKVS
jgi:WD40 repeat protein